MAFWNDHIANQVKQFASKLDQSYTFCRFGKFVEYDPETNSGKVQWYNPYDETDDSLKSGFLPILQAPMGRGDDSESGVGDTWGMVCPPNINEQVLVISQHGDFTNGIILGSIYSIPRPPPDIEGDKTQVGEWSFKHKTGSYIKFHNSGDVTIYSDRDMIFKSNRDLLVTVARNATVDIVGDLDAAIGGHATANVSGNITASTGADMTFNTSGNMFNNVNGSWVSGVNGDTTMNMNGQLYVNAKGNIGLVSAADVGIDTRDTMYVNAINDISLHSNQQISLETSTILFDADTILSSDITSATFGPQTPVT